MAAQVHPIRPPWALNLAKPRREIWRHLAVAARINLFTVFPLVLLLLLFSDRPTWAGFARTLGVVLVFTNCNFLVLNGFYHRVWQRLSRPRAWMYALLCLAILPGLGAVAFLGGKLLLDLFVPGLLDGRGPALMGTSVLVSVLYGLAVFTIEDYRRRQHTALDELEWSRRREHELRRAQKEAELLALQALMKPHFVFNTLNAITALIHDDPDKAEETTIRLARLMRHILEMGDDTMVSLDAEMTVARAYLEIEKVRLGNRLSYDIDVPETLLLTPVPGLLLQPLVENAVKHGVRQRSDAGYVHVRAWADGDHCQAEVVDNGPGFSQHKGTGRSMRLVRERLDRIYGRDYELTLARDERLGETVVSLRIPSMPPRESSR